MSFSPAGGKLSLQPWMGHLVLPEVDTWGEMEPTKQTAHTLLFHKGPKVKPPRDVPKSSKDGTVTMFEKSKIAPKPGNTRKAKTPVVKVDKTPRDRPAGKKKKNLDFLDQSDSLEEADIESAGEEDSQLKSDNRQKQKKLSPIKRPLRGNVRKKRKVIIGGASGDVDSSEEDLKSETKKRPVRRNLLSSIQSKQESVTEKRHPRPRNVKPLDTALSDETDVDTMVEKAIKEKAEKKAATLEKENRDKWWAGLDDDDNFQTPKLSKRESKRPNYLEDFHVSSQKKNKGKKGKKNKEKSLSLSLMYDALEGLGVKKKTKK